jgi:D-alanine-D-alanine ligase
VAAFAGIQTARLKCIFLSIHLLHPMFILRRNSNCPYLLSQIMGGSSIGMSKVNKPDELEEALTKAFKEDDQILIEEFIFWS